MSHLPAPTAPARDVSIAFRLVMGQYFPSAIRCQLAVTKQGEALERTQGAELAALSLLRGVVPYL